MESFKRCPEYQSELAKYGVGAFVICFKEVSWALIKKGVDVTMLVFFKLRGGTNTFIVDPTEGSWIKLKYCSGVGG